MKNRIPSFKDFLEAELKHISEDSLYESPVAAKGDLVTSLLTTDISELVIELNWRLRGTIRTNSKTLEVLKHKQENCYIVGEMIQGLDEVQDKPRFAVYTRIHLRDEKIKGTSYVSVSRVETRTDNQGEGIATALYKFLVLKEKIKLLSDSIQFFGARRLWAKLSKEMIVDVIDSESGDLLIKNVKLHQGKIDKDIDERVWSYVDELEQDYSKDYIRFILKDIK